MTSRPRRGRTAAAAALAALTAFAALAPGSTATAGRGTSEPSSAVHAWQRTAIRTIYTQGASPVPIGVPYLGFTSLAMHDAALAAARRHASPSAALAVAAHDVLAAYFPSSRAGLDADLTATLAGVPDGRAEDRGVDIGARVAARLVADRADDGRNDPSITYSKPAAPGVWQPAPGGAMLAPWIGFMDPLLVRRPTRVGGPDALSSRQYTRDVLEVQRIGAAVGADRTAHQTETALFMNTQSAILVSDALLRHLDAAPRGLLDTTRLFAAMHVGMADTLIQCWRLKYDVGFWRPIEAIRKADTDGNPATVADPTWTPLVTTPSYSDYVSGHGCLTAPAVEAIRQTLGEGTSLTLHSNVTNSDRTYPTLSAIEYDAFMARIWSGLHFRTAMEDAYRIGHDTADRVLRRLG